MKLLSLSTAEQGCSLAITDGDALICEEFWTSKQTHSKRLVKMIDHMLEDRSGLKLEEIDGFVAAKGPGSFTGLRIGISVIKGLAYAVEKPAFGVSSLDGIAFQFICSSIPVCVMMDAKRNEVYCAVYAFDNGKLISKSNEMVINPKDAIRMTNGSTLFAGSGSKVYKDVIEQEAANCVFAPKFINYVNATALVQSLFSQENFIKNPENILTPSYIRKSDAELQFVEK
jgi:tRNA threonylcarbamoyladenosine biosynthesis protein TsaB